MWRQMLSFWLLVRWRELCIEQKPGRSSCSIFNTTSQASPSLTKTSKWLEPKLVIPITCACFAVLVIASVIFWKWWKWRKNIPKSNVKELELEKFDKTELSAEELQRFELQATSLRLEMSAGRDFHELPA
jgi:hypothetical protein